MKISNKITFDNTEIAFSDKSKWDLRRMYFLFSTMNHPFIASIGIWLTLLAIKLRLPVRGMIKSTIFHQFCGGESLKDSKQTIAILSQSNIKSILDYSAEGEDSEVGFDANKMETLSSLEFAKASDDIPTGVMKLSGFIRNEILVKVQNGDQLNASENEQYDHFKSRVEEVCTKAVELGKYMFIDAEETWIQDPIDEMVYDMMLKFNKERVYIFNTYQLYRKDALQNMKDTHEKLTAKNCYFGAKLVRGAYMEKERDRALKMGYPDPIQPNKAATDIDYDEAIKYCLAHIDNMAVCTGTHNENSSAYQASLMEAYNIAKDDPRVYFAQLFGMSDNISYQLADKQYNIAKYLPYGALEKVMPYLIRRAEENTSMSGQSSREFSLVKKEMKRRKG
jgi:proline dehydrogenase